MTDIIQQVQESFESIKMEDETWFEFWSARDLMAALWYSKWERFSLVIRKAKQNCKSSWGIIEDNFLDEKEFFQEAGKTHKAWWRPRENYFLTRYACYLVALNADSRFEAVSLAKTYFANQTRKLELYEENIDNEKRLVAREKLKKTEWEIERTIFQRWIKLPAQEDLKKVVKKLKNADKKKLK
jgi:DNA-damage-inducible protein D